MSLHDALQDLADQLATPDAPVRMRLGTITTVTAGASADGVAAATVTVGGAALPAPYLASYTPTVGHVVAVVFTHGSPLILGRVVGLPNLT